MSSLPLLCSAGPTIRAYPGFDPAWSEHMRAQAQADLDLVCEHHEPLIEHLENICPGADFEDFWEPLARSAAAIRAAQALGRTIVFTPGDTQWTPEMMNRRLGSVYTHEEARHVADPLLDHSLVRQHGGRWMALAGFSEDLEEPLENDVTHLLLERARAGVEKVVIKMAERKTGLDVIELHPQMTLKEINYRLNSTETFYGLFHLLGRPNTVLLQDWIPMQYEYRLFVVDGVVVSGSACIEEFTPYSRKDTPTRFDSRMRAIRGNQIAGQADSEIVDRPGRKDLYLAAGSRIGAEYGGTVTVDLATVTKADGTSQIVLVELNTLPNSGLYASDVDAVYRALASAEDKGYSSYALITDYLPTNFI